MPELPEVETVKEVLKKQLKGLKIIDFKLYHEAMLKTGDVETFKHKILNQTVVDIKRRGKYLIFELNDYYLLSHLRMEGKFFYVDGTAPDENIRMKHVHANFEFSNGSCLFYEDVRKFGTFHLYERDVNLEETPPFTVLGVEPFTDDFTSDYLLGKFQKKTMPIKSLLLSQSVVCGLGNIYVDEVLFMSGIHPMTQSQDVTVEQIQNIVKYTNEILQRAITLKGTTIKTFTSQHGMAGEYQNELKVHTKVGEECPQCKMTIEKIKVGGRGTYFCPTCQTEK